MAAEMENKDMDSDLKCVLTLSEHVHTFTEFEPDSLNLLVLFLVSLLYFPVLIC